MNTSQKREQLTTLMEDEQGNCHQVTFDRTTTTVQDWGGKLLGADIADDNFWLGSLPLQKLEDGSFQLPDGSRLRIVGR